MIEMQLNDHVALVTGGAAGIGLAIVKEMLQNGLKVSILDINSAVGETTLATISTEFGKDRVIFIQTDVTNKKQFEDAFEETIKQFGRIDVVVNNAGVTDKDKKLMVDVNLGAVITGTLLGMKHMTKELTDRGGTIINIASLWGLIPCFISPTYNSTKHGVIGLVRSFGQQYYLDKTAVRVMALCPGFTDTSMPTYVQQKLVEQNLQDLSFMKEQLDKMQETSVCGKSVMYMLKHGNNGSIWIATNGDLSIVDYPNVMEHVRTVVAGI